DFTYVDDIVEGIVRTLDKPAQPDPNWDASKPDPATSNAPFRIYNIGSNNPIQLSRYIEVLEQELGVTAEKNLLGLQPGDVADTFADVSDLVTDMNYQPDTPIEHGIREFVKWYRDYYKV
ncbi:MAG: capsular biosynthesis protein CpsI, partial [Pseudomonadales bacterium]